MHTKICVDCGASFQCKSNKQKRCSACIQTYQRRYGEIYRRNKKGAEPLSPTIVCQTCGDEVIRTAPNQIYCAVCRIVKKYELPKQPSKQRSLMDERDPSEIRRFYQFQKILFYSLKTKFDRNISTAELITIVMAGFNKEMGGTGEEVLRCLDDLK